MYTEQRSIQSATITGVICGGESGNAEQSAFASAASAFECRFHNLRFKLGSVLDPPSQLWIANGFEQPGTVALTTELFGGGYVKPSRASATHYQIWRQAQGTSAYELHDRIDDTTDYLFESLTVGNKNEFRVRGVNDTNAGLYSSEVTVT